MRVYRAQDLGQLLGVDAEVNFDGEYFSGKLYYKPKGVEVMRHGYADYKFVDQAEGYVFLCDNEEGFFQFFDGHWAERIKFIQSLNHFSLKESKPSKLYLAGDIMTKGSQLARKQELEDLMENLENTFIYSPVANADINDKSNVTEEENNGLAERIVKADVDRLLESDTVVLEYQPNAIGTITELGILYGFRKSAELIEEIINDPFELDYVKFDKMQELLNKLKPLIRVHSDDLRNTNLKESGFRRSHSINQFAYGVILELAEDIKDWDTIVKELKFREEHVFND